MSEQSNTTIVPPHARKTRNTVFTILGAISISHLLNDMIQSLILAIYPLLQSEFNLSFVQIGMITLTYQITASLLQPLIGLYTDKHPQPYSLPIGMSFTLSGLLLLAYAESFPIILLASALVGTGSSVFHPESSRVARMASGGRHGLAQSLFQVGGNFGTSLGPLLAAAFIAPYGKGNVGWFSLAALLGIVVLLQVSKWYKTQNHTKKNQAKTAPVVKVLSRKTVISSLSILLILVFSKYFYLTSISSYYTFYLMHKFSISVQNAQLHLFIFLFAVAAGTIIGGPIGDKIGRKYVIWISILGVAPFTLILPYASLYWTSILSVIIGVILASAFSAILVYAQELIPGKTGMVSSLFFGLAFGMGGIGAAVLGYIADRTSIELVYQICAFLPLLGIFTALLPNIEDKN
ncbi:Fosmidomycin resistance protein [Photorhabdus temperata]|uniref:Arabinose efflux permease family protein n=1 Tax=Photorhabdus khanii NC19 TaxID=1004151 RepID=W3VB47_9GAMM|nr:MFS transporter [Photorhabdus khanii]ETS33151.1 arabinose efflux permease family protein [Photorhabdus khanii NC19]OHV53545.1 Fosmidomycin resistance protein [Photorhabdus temperata]